MKFGMKVSMPKNFDTAKAINELAKGLDIFVTKNVTGSFEATTRTWRNKPKWQWQSKRTERELTSTVYTSSKIYSYLNFGTRVRYATMTANFQAKTVANFIGSRAGRGGVAFINRLIPRPGIKPRNFDTAIAKRWQPKFEAKMKPYFIRAAKASGHFRR